MESSPQVFFSRKFRFTINFNLIYLYSTLYIFLNNITFDNMRKQTNLLGKISFPNDLIKKISRYTEGQNNCDNFDILMINITR